MSGSTLGPWRSERLIYRAIEDDDEAFMHKSTTSDIDSWLNAAPFLPAPQGKKDAKDSIAFFRSRILSAIICLPAPEPSQSNESNAQSTEPPNGTTTETKDSEKKEPQPIPIGFLHLGEHNPKQFHYRRTEIGINIISTHQGQGYGSEAIKWALNWGFHYAGLHKIEIGAFSHNERAVRLYKRLGFVEEGRLRDHFWHEGAWSDLVMLSMLEDEWRAKYRPKK